MHTWEYSYSKQNMARDNEFLSFILIALGILNSVQKKRENESQVFYTIKLTNNLNKVYCNGV